MEHQNYSGNFGRLSMPRPYWSWESLFLNEPRSFPHLLSLCEKFEIFQWKSGSWDFPGSPLVKTVLPIKGTWVQSLVGELRSHMLCGASKNFFLIWVQIYWRHPFSLLLLLLSRFSRVRLCATPYTAAHQAPHPWDSPGKNTGVGCHFLLQCMKLKSESEVAQSCPTLSNPMDCSLPGSSVHGVSRQEYWSGVPLPSPPILLTG